MTHRENFLPVIPRPSRLNGLLNEAILSKQTAFSPSSSHFSDNKGNRSQSSKKKLAQECYWLFDQLAMNSYQSSSFSLSTISNVTSTPRRRTLTGIAQTTVESSSEVKSNETCFICETPPVDIFPRSTTIESTENRIQRNNEQFLRQKKNA